MLVPFTLGMSEDTLKDIDAIDTDNKEAELLRENLKKLLKKGFVVVINLAIHNKGALKKEDKIVF